MNKMLKKILIIVCVIASITIPFFVGYLVAPRTTVVLNPPTKKEYGNLETVLDYLKNKFYYGENSEEYYQKLIQDAVDGMVDRQNDPYTDYMTAEELGDFNSSLTSTFVGIGVSYYNVNEKIFIIKVLDDSPAQRAGIQVGDMIVAVDGDSTIETSVDHCVEIIKGEAGSDVVLDVARNGEIIKVTVTRAPVTSTVSLDIHDSVGIIRVDSFSDYTWAEFATALLQLREKNIKKIVIDLRNNGGGWATCLDMMCYFLMDDGDIIRKELSRDGSCNVVTVSSYWFDNYRYALDANTYPRLVQAVNNNESMRFKFDDIAVLTNVSSASCSEVFALALRENCQAKIVGLNSYGKNLVQNNITFADGSALKYTTTCWTSGNDVSVKDTGIIVDKEVKLDESLYGDYIQIKDDVNYQYDSVSNDVAKMQLILRYLDYDIDRVDGYFSSQTVVALKAFQKDCGIKDTGILDSLTGELLNTENLKAYNLDKYNKDYQLMEAIKIVK